ncbi:Transcription cofactor vestigial-like protein 1 [Triplophysa tibetana]|uniref:Transcription cofactor vestigial-like protein 1 n=1 Tax=Triplophysa tibetana TaxID=1572043 RepID=A0A5A9N2U3_9TELE|nr:Transcription cofactor vestigial-like protein 1 [Triplophysa tibetana]
MMAEEKSKDAPQLFTYYQGDINTAVDEHFFRALNKATIPKDLSTKAKDSKRTFKSDLPQSSWAYPYNSPKLSQLTPVDNAHPPQGVIMNPPGSSSSLWPSSSRQGTAFELPQMLYPQHSSPQSTPNSYLNLLQMDRHSGGIMISPYSKTDARPEWNAGTAYKDIPGSRMGLDSGVPVTETSKDLYWY